MIKFPEHKCGLYLGHNEHKDSYQSVLEFIADREDLYDWKSEESKRRAAETNEMWTLQWYPDTPVGFNTVAAPTLEELLEFASSTD